MNVLAVVVTIMSCSFLRLTRVNAWTTATKTTKMVKSTIPSLLRNRAICTTRPSLVPLQGYNSFRYSDDFITTRRMNSNSADTGSTINSTSNNVILQDVPGSDSAAADNTTSSSMPADNNNNDDLDRTNGNEKDFRTEFKSILLNEDTVNVLGINPADVKIEEKNGTTTTTTPNGNIQPTDPAVSDMFRSSQFVDMFRGSATYIANHRNTLMVFHIPGELIDHHDSKIFRDLINDISLTWLLGIKIVIVAGCRYQVEKRLGNGRNKHMGMAVTDRESLRVVKEEAGYVRFEVERQLARSLQGSRGRLGDGNVVSGNFYSAQPFGVIDGVDYQYSGFIRRFETEKINQCHANRDIVLLTALGVSPTGEIFNVNSEYLASYAGGALKASKVLFFLENDVGLKHRVHGTKIPHLRVNDGDALLKMNDVHMHKKGFVFVGDDCPYDGYLEQNMLVKIGWSMQAIQGGVKRVHIISPENGALLQELYTRDGSGTMISSDLYDGIKPATVNDVSGIHDLISPLIEMGTLVDRPKAKLEQSIDEYHVYTRDDLIVACGQMKLFENGFAEIGCLVVNPAYRARGRGDAMLGYLERRCVSQGASTVFVLSTQTMEWFVERGFDAVGVEMLPPSRQATYNRSRNSKIYMKRFSSVRDLDASELFWNT